MSLGLRVVEVVGKRFLLVQELLDGLVEDGLIKEARDCRDGSVLLGDLLPVTEEAELVFGDPGDLLEHVVRCVVVEVGESDVPVAVRHEEHGDGAREAA